MLFNSPVFLFAFLPVTLAVYFLLEHLSWPRRALSWLVAASLFFYGWWQWAYLPLILSSIAVNYGLGRLMERCAAKARGTVLLTGIIFNLTLLGYYKYASFLDGIVVGLTEAGFGLEAVALPLAISFFTFQQIIYLMDVHKTGRAQRRLESYMLFVTFFPHLIAGPLVHHRQMLPQFDRSGGRRWLWINAAVGGTIFVIGLAKKLLLADPLAATATPLFELAGRGTALSWLEAWCAALAYAGQIYFDFSGYSDMAIGLARLFGVRLPLNFASPYKAASISDFWRRWHMTLSAFLRDYLYIPLGGNRRGPVQRYVNLALTMLLGGLWHGANWTFVLWGGMHGVLLAVHHAWRAARPCKQNRFWNGAAWALVSRLLTFLAVVAAWVMFRAPGVEVCLSIWRSMFLPAGNPFAAGLAGSDAVFLLIGAALGLAWFAPSTQEIMARFCPAFDAPKPTTKACRWCWRPSPAWTLAAALLWAACCLSLSQVSEFIYFNF